MTIPVECVEIDALPAHLVFGEKGQEETMEKGERLKRS